MTQAQQVDGRGLTATQDLDAASFDRIAKIVHEESGIILGEGKKSLTVSRLARRLRVLQLDDFRAYCSLLEGPNGADERLEMLLLLTTNVTRFFREDHHFEALKTSILPPLVDRARSGGRVRIWSAACSSGEEPYSIAITLLEAFPDALRHDIRILATDIDTNMIRAGRTARYRRLTDDDISDARLRKHFVPVPDEPECWHVAEDVRQLVTFGALNLQEPWPMRGTFDAIFCRNVVIYFDSATQARLWTRFADILSPGGTLFIGHSERVSGPGAARFKCSGVTQYQLLPNS